MAYTNAIFYLDLESGSDTTRTTLSGCTASNPAGSTTRINKTAHGLVTGAVVDTTNFTAWLNGAWKITKVDNDYFDLDTAVWQATADATGDVVPRGGSSRADAWKTSVTGPTSARISAGDTIRVKATKQYTVGASPSTWTKFLNTAAVAVVSSTNATPIKVRVSAGNYAILALSVGHTVHITGHTTNTNANGVWEVSALDGGNYDITLVDAQGGNSVGNGVGGASGTIQNICDGRVMLPAAVTKNIACYGNQGTAGRTNWTASANVTCTVDTTYFTEAYASQKIDVAAAFTTGMAAYWPLPSTLDLSAYSGISLNAAMPTGAILTNISIKLCSDAAGTAVVNTLTLTNGGAGAANLWHNFALDSGGSLGASIASVRLDINSDQGAQALYVDNIIAIKGTSAADRLHNASVISAGNSETHDQFIGVSAINGVRVILACTPLAAQAGQFGSASVPYMGASGSNYVTSYDSYFINNYFINNRAGTEAAPITYSFGWDMTDMSAQTGKTWIEGNGAANTYVFVSGAFVVYDAPCTVRCGGAGFGALYSPSVSGTAPAKYVNPVCVSSYGSAMSVLTTGITQVSGALKAARSTTYGVQVSAGGRVYAPTVNVAGCGTAGMIAGAGTRIDVGAANAVKNVIAAHVSGGALTIGSLGSGGHTSATLRLELEGTAKIRTITTPAGTTADAANVLSNNTAGYPVGRGSIGTVAGGVGGVYWPNAKAEPSQVQRYTASGYSVACAVTQTNCSASFPAKYPLGKIVLQNGVTTTVGIWVYRTSTNIKGLLVFKGGQVVGIDTDLTTACEPSINGWYQFTLALSTHSETAWGELEFWFWDGVGTTNILYFDALTLT